MSYLVNKLSELLKLVLQSKVIPEKYSNLLKPQSCEGLTVPVGRSYSHESKLSRK